MMKNQLKTLILFTLSFAFILLFVQCTIVNGNGKISSITFQTANYDKIVLDGSMDVELISGKEGKIVVEAEENILELIVINVHNGTLSIDTKNGVGFSTTKGIKVTVPVEEISSVNLDGSGDIHSNFPLRAENFNAELNGSGNIVLDLDVKSMKTVLDGSGNITLSGKAEFLNSVLDGSGNIEAFELFTKEVNANLNGSGNINVFAEKKINADLDGSGNITYKGDPTETMLNSDSGAGNISKL